MKFILNKDVFTIEDAETINSGSVNYYEAEVEYDESWENLAIKAVLLESEEGTAKQTAVINNKVFLDREEFGSFKVGFIGYTIENEQKIYQISTNLQSIFIQKGTGSIEVVEGDIPTPTEWEIYIAQIQKMLDEIKESEGTTDYNNLENKPKINGVELKGNKTPRELNIPTFEDLSNYVMLQYSERIGHFVSNSGVNYEINTETKEITINDGFLFYLGQRQNDLQSVKTTLKIATGSAFCYIVYDLKGTTGNKLLSIVQADFDPTRHVLMCIIRSGYYTIPSANWIEGRYKVDGVLYNPEELNYNNLEDKPKINGVELKGNKTPRELNIPTLEDLSNYVMLQYSERIGHFLSNSGVNYEINTTTKEITINDGFLFYLGQRQKDIVKTTLKIATGSVFSYLVYDLKGSDGNKLLSIIQADFDPTRHVLMCIIRSGYYTIPSANWIEGRYKVDGVLYNPEEPKEPEKAIEKVYVSTTGTDTNNETGDANHPFLTINKAVNSGAKTIFVMAGTYKERITKSNSGGEIEIIAKPLNTTDKKDVIIDLGYELPMVADSTTGLVKGAYTSTANDFIYKVFVTKEKPIKYVANNTENKEVSLGYTCNLWNGNTRLTPVLSLDECKNTSNTWFYDGTNVYANAEAGTFVLDNGDNQYGINLSYYKKVKLIGVTVKYASEIGAWLKGCSETEISRCKFLNTGVYHGLKLESTSSTVRNCEAAYNGKDGLNIHGVCTADFIDCISHDNLDDGISHHVGSGGMVIGGEYYNNVKGGVCSPTFGSRNGVNGVYTHNNGDGIYAVTQTDGDYPPCTVSNCMIKENTVGIRASRYTFNCWNNILLNNGTDTSEENGGVINIYSGSEGGNVTVQNNIEEIGRYISTLEAVLEIDSVDKKVTVNKGFLFYRNIRLELKEAKTVDIKQDSASTLVVYDTSDSTNPIKNILFGEFNVKSMHVIAILYRGDYKNINANYIRGAYKVDGVLYNNATLDKTLTKEGYPADAKAVGDALNNLGGSNGEEWDYEKTITIEEEEVANITITTFDDGTPLALKKVELSAIVDATENCIRKFQVIPDLYYQQNAGNITVSSGTAAIEAGKATLCRIEGNIIEGVVNCKYGIDSPKTRYVSYYANPLKMNEVSIGLSFGSDGGNYTPYPNKATCFHTIGFSVNAGSFKTGSTIVIKGVKA